jgi:hypothetical protein
MLVQVYSIGIDCCQKSNGDNSVFKALWANCVPTVSCRFDGQKRVLMCFHKIRGKQGRMKLKSPTLQTFAEGEDNQKIKR